MYHYDPETALEELKEDALLPKPAYIRDMIIRSKLQPDQALRLNRQLQTYIQVFNDAHQTASLILQKLAGRES